MSIEFKTMDELVNIILNDSTLRRKAVKFMSMKTVSMSFDGVTGCGVGRLRELSFAERRCAWAQLLLCLKSELQGVWDERHYKYLSKHNPDGSYPIGYDHFPSPVLNTNQQGTTTMNNSTAQCEPKTATISIVTFVFGADIAKMEADNLISFIEQCRNEITRLKGLKIESTYVGKQVDELNKAITLLIKQLDNR